MAQPSRDPNDHRGNRCGNVLTYLLIDGLTTIGWQAKDCRHAVGLHFIIVLFVAMGVRQILSRDRMKQTPKPTPKTSSGGNLAVDLTGFWFGRIQVAFVIEPGSFCSDALGGFPRCSLPVAVRRAAKFRFSLWWSGFVMYGYLDGALSFAHDRSEPEYTLCH